MPGMERPPRYVKWKKRQKSASNESMLICKEDYIDKCIYKFTKEHLEGCIANCRKLIFLGVRGEGGHRESVKGERRASHKCYPDYFNLIKIETIQIFIIKNKQQKSYFSSM